MRRLVLTLVIALALAPARADDQTATLLSAAWPAAPGDLSEMGRGIGVVFSPDLSVPGNCAFYQALGFACFENADWLQILADIHAYGIANPDRRITTLVMETHGTNGHGLKVQTGKKPEDDRSYIAIAALQEILESVGVRHIILSACNSGRLLRPEIYLKLNREPGDPLFLPATRGIIDATDSFNPKKTRVTVVTPATSRIETTVVGALRELSPATRKAVEEAARGRGITLPKRFAISEMFILLLTRAPELRLRTGAHVEELSKEQTPPEGSERLFRSFVAHLDGLTNGTIEAAAVAMAH